MKTLLTIFFTILGISTASVFLDERFSDGDAWTERWIPSNNTPEAAGKFVLSHGKFYGDAIKDVGIQTATNASFYGISTGFQPFSNKDKTLVLQLTVKHEQDIDCGGGYIKLFDCSLKPEELNADSPYLIMFGPDKCGASRKVHVIFNYKGKNHLINKQIRPKDDIFTHLYTLIVHPNQTYEVLLDNETVESGELEADWDFLPHKRKITDPEAKRPDDWDVPEYVADLEAKQPEDWDEEMDGDWEPPTIKNPNFRDEWKLKQIDNPDFKGGWVAPEIDNPEYLADPSIGKYDEICFAGFDLWQVKAGTIFDNILITDDPAEAKRIGDELWRATSKAEIEMKTAQDILAVTANANTGDDVGDDVGSRDSNQDDVPDPSDTDILDIERASNDGIDAFPLGGEAEHSNPATEELGRREENEISLFNSASTSAVIDANVKTDSKVAEVESSKPTDEEHGNSDETRIVVSNSAVADEPLESNPETVSCGLAEPEKPKPDTVSCAVATTYPSDVVIGDTPSTLITVPEHEEL